MSAFPISNLSSTLDEAKLSIGSVEFACNCINAILRDKKIEQLNAECQKISTALLQAAKGEKNIYIKNAVIVSIIALAALALLTFFFAIKVALPISFIASLFSLITFGYLVSYIETINCHVFYMLSYHKQNAKALQMTESFFTEHLKSLSVPASPAPLSHVSSTSASSSSLAPVSSSSSLASSSVLASGSSNAASSSSSQALASSPADIRSSANVASSSASSSSRSVASSSSFNAVSSSQASSAVLSSAPSPLALATPQQIAAFDALEGTPEQKEIIESLFAVLAEKANEAKKAESDATWLTRPLIKGKIYASLGAYRIQQNERISRATTVHPLKFFYWMLTTPSIKTYFRTIFESDLLGENVKEEYFYKMNEQLKTNNLLIHLPAFVERSFGDRRYIDNNEKKARLNDIFANIQQMAIPERWEMTGHSDFGSANWEAFINYLLNLNF